MCARPVQPIHQTLNNAKGMRWKREQRQEDREQNAHPPKLVFLPSIILCLTDRQGIIAIERDEEESESVCVREKKTLSLARTHGRMDKHDLHD